ncbi:hypothetical protein Tco_0299448 [Tanacetum coccineum]
MYRPQRASPPPSQSSPIPAFNLDDDNFEPLWASASQPFQPYSEGPSQPVEDDSPVEEVELVKPKAKFCSVSSAVITTCVWSLCGLRERKLS